MFNDIKQFAYKTSIMKQFWPPRPKRRNIIKIGYSGDDSEKKYFIEYRL